MQKTHFYHKIVPVISGKFYFIGIYLRYTGYYISCREAASGLLKFINDRWVVDTVVILISSSSDIPFSQCDHRPPRGLHSVHHSWKFCPALARDVLQHVHLLLPVPAAAGHHDHLLHQDLL